MQVTHTSVTWDTEELHGVSMLSVVFPSLMTMVIVKKCGRKRAEFQHVNSDQCPWAAFVLVAHADQCGPMWMISGACESSKIVMAAMAHWQSREYSFFGQKSLVKASYEIQKLRDDFPASLVDNFPKIQVQEAHDLDLRAHRFIMVFSTLAAAAGATPWPFLEFFLLLGILRTMSMDLARTYGLVLRPSFQWQLLASFPKISAIFVAAIMLGSLLKITPNLRALGGLINAIMISWYNTAMGSLLQEIFRRLRFRNPMGEVAFSDVCQAGLDLDPGYHREEFLFVFGTWELFSSIFLWNLGRMRIFLIQFKGLKMIDDQISENPPEV